MIKKNYYRINRTFKNTCYIYATLKMAEKQTLLKAILNL